MPLLVCLFWIPLQAEYHKCVVTITLVRRTVSALPPILLRSSRGMLIAADNWEFKRAMGLNGQCWAAPTKAERFTFPWLEHSWAEVHQEVTCCMPQKQVCCLTSTAQWQCAWMPPEPAQTTHWVESCLHQGRVLGALQAVSLQGAAAWLCLNSHFSYSWITISLVLKVLAGILRSQGGAEVVMATTLCSWFSMLGIELGEQNCESGTSPNVAISMSRVWALLYMTRVEIPIILIFLVVLHLKQSKPCVCPLCQHLRGPN